MSILMKSESKRGQCMYLGESFFSFSLFEVFPIFFSRFSNQRQRLFDFFFFLPDKSVEDHDDKFGEAGPPKFVLAGFQASRGSIEENRDQQSAEIFMFVLRNE